MTNRAPLVLAILCTLALSSFAVPTHSFLKQDGALTTENPELDNISDEMELMEPDAFTNESPELDNLSDEMGFVEPDTLTSENPEVENFSDEMELMETGASGYHLCTQAGGKIIIENPKNTTGCTALTVCASSNAVGAGNVRLWTGTNKSGKCYEFGAGTYTGTIATKSVELGLDVERVSFTTHNSASTFTSYASSTTISGYSTMEVRVMDPDVVRCYFLPAFQGHYFDVTASTLKNTNTLVRSVRVGRNLDGVRLYSSINYGGSSYSYTTHLISSLPSSLNGDVESMQVYKDIHPNTVRLFSGPNYTGALIDLSGRRNLSSYGWNNVPGSMKLGENVRFAILYDLTNQDDTGVNHVFTKKLVPTMDDSISKKASSIEIVLECPK